MKSYTDLEQSKKLAEILPIESADAFYDMAEPDKRRVPIIGDPDDYYDMEDWTIPCWSLAALIEVLPLGINIHNISDGHKTYYYVELYTKEIYMKLKRMGKEEICLSSERHENLVDACVEMILKLKEKDLL